MCSTYLIISGAQVEYCLGRSPSKYMSAKERNFKFKQSQMQIGDLEIKIQKKALSEV